jgi:hypothetical protein
MVTELIAEGFTEEEIVSIYVENGFSEIQARGIVAIELGRERDVVDVIAITRDR